MTNVDYFILFGGELESSRSDLLENLVHKQNLTINKGVILSGGKIGDSYTEVHPEARNYRSEADRMLKYLHPKLPQLNYYLDELAQDSLGNLVYSADLMTDFRSIGLGTDDYHMPRVLRLCKWVFPPSVEIIPFTTIERGDINKRVFENVLGFALEQDLRNARVERYNLNQLEQFLHTHHPDYSEDASGLTVLGTSLYKKIRDIHLFNY